VPKVRLPEQMAVMVRDILEGKKEPVTPRDAATVMLLRPAAGEPPRTGHGFEVYMLRRKPTMAFAPGAYVFPGGSVDQRDADEEVAWAGPEVAAWAQQLATTPQLARALVCAAVRETFEESGVLLAGPTAGTVVADTTGEDWEADRQGLLDRSQSLAELLAKRGLILRSDLLRPWSRWITPALEPRRFDARFFAAALPEGQLTRDVGGEASAVQWISPAAALDAGRAGEIELWFPTAMTLAELADHEDVGAVLAANREITPRLPELRIEDGEAWIEAPGDKEYPL
jgi:8-oxo-dGTP pyrophosphatase MutT (NUDIX family)